MNHMTKCRRPRNCLRYLFALFSAFCNLEHLEALFGRKLTVLAILHCFDTMKRQIRENSNKTSKCFQIAKSRKEYKKAKTDSWSPALCDSNDK